jgi:hypothetical protein
MFARRVNRKDEKRKRKWLKDRNKGAVAAMDPGAWSYSHPYRPRTRPDFRSPLDRVVIFTSNLRAAECLLDPSAHSGQSESLAIADGLWQRSSQVPKDIFLWSTPLLNSSTASRGPPSRMRCPLVGPFTRQDRPPRSIDHLRSAATEYALGVLVGKFSFFSYRGHNFLNLNEGMFGPPVKLSHLERGPWMRAFGDNPQLFARGCRATLCHGPIGEYRPRFFPSANRLLSL